MIISVLSKLKEEKMTHSLASGICGFKRKGSGLYRISSWQATNYTIRMSGLTLELIYEKEGNSIRIKDYNLIRTHFNRARDNLRPAGFRPYSTAVTSGNLNSNAAGQSTCTQ